MAKLPSGTKLAVIGSANGWSHVIATLPNGALLEGYVMDEYIAEPAPTVEPGTPVNKAAQVITRGSSLRLRTGPSTRYNIVARMPNGASITILSTRNGWARIRFVSSKGSQYEGWASERYLGSITPTAAPAAKPTETPAPAETVEPSVTPEPDEAIQPTDTPTPDETVEPAETAQPIETDELADAKEPVDTPASRAETDGTDGPQDAVEYV